MRAVLSLSTVAILLISLPAVAYIGDVCTGDAQCATGETCIKAADSTFPGGFCTVPPSPTCPTGTTAGDITNYGSFCVITCTITPTCNASACRPGLVCQYTGTSGGETAGICDGPCTANSDCPSGKCNTANGMCQSNGGINQCTGPATRKCDTAGVSCALRRVCNATTHLCENPGVTIGTPCSTDPQCGPIGACIQENFQGTATGWAGGYCSQQCDPAVGDCPSKSVCVNFGPSGAFCMSSCTDNTACRGCTYACDTRGGANLGYCTASCSNPGYGCGAGLACNPFTKLCVASCTQVACTGAGQTCDQNTGVCNTGSCDVTPCPAGQVCSAADKQCRIQGCAQTGCAPGQFCDTRCNQCISLALACETTGCPAGQLCSTSTHVCGTTGQCELTGCGCGQVCNPITHNCEPARCEVDEQCPKYAKCDGNSKRCACFGRACVKDTDCLEGDRCDPGGLVCFTPGADRGNGAKKSCGGCGGAPGGLLALGLALLGWRRRRVRMLS